MGTQEHIPALVHLVSIRSRKAVTGEGIAFAASSKAFNPVFHVAFDRSGQLLAAAAGQSETVVVIDVAKRRVAFELPPGEERIHPSCVAFSPDSRLLAAAGNYGKKLLVYDLKSRAKPRMIDLGGRNGGELAFSPDGKVLAAAVIEGEAGSLALFDVATWKGLAEPSAHSSPANLLAFAAGGKLILVGTADGVVQVWGARREEPPGGR